MSPQGSLSEEQRAFIEGSSEALPGLMMPVPSHDALTLLVIHALRDMSFQQREGASAIRDLRTSMEGFKEQTYAMKTCIEKVQELELQIKTLMAAEQRRDGMSKLIEWVGRYFPWFAAAAAAIWALKAGPRQ